MKLSELTGLVPMGCGGCGHRLFSVGDRHGMLYVQCDKCDSISVVKAAPAEIAIEWGPSGDGILARVPE